MEYIHLVLVMLIVTEDSVVGHILLTSVLLLLNQLYLELICISNCLEESNLISLYVCGGHLFAKCIAHKTVVSTYTSSDIGPFCIHILRYRRSNHISSDDDSFSFSISVYGKNSGLIF